jgi:hypothetical protein
MTLGPDSARSSTGRLGRWAGVVGALVVVLMLAGCPGTLDPSLVKEASGGGGISGTGGSTGTGGTNNCTGSLDGATMVMAICATSGCHDPVDANFSGGLDLTVDSGIGSRLVGASAGTAAQGSLCTGMGPYLDAGSTPATGLLIDKITMSQPPCGGPMPAGPPFVLTATQQNCLIKWATTLTSP